MRFGFACMWNRGFVCLIFRFSAHLTMLDGENVKAHLFQQSYLDIIIRNVLFVAVLTDRE